MKKLICIAVMLIAMGVASACDGYYEVRYENVLVCAPHYEQVWTVCGPRTVFCPARYERRPVRVFVPTPRSGSGGFNFGAMWNWRAW